VAAPRTAAPERTFGACAPVLRFAGLVPPGDRNGTRCCFAPRRELTLWRPERRAECATRALWCIRAW